MCARYFYSMKWGGMESGYMWIPGLRNIDDGLSGWCGYIKEWDTGGAGDYRMKS